MPTFCDQLYGLMPYRQHKMIRRYMFHGPAVLIIQSQPKLFEPCAPGFTPSETRLTHWWPKAREAKCFLAALISEVWGNLQPSEINPPTRYFPEHACRRGPPSLRPILSTVRSTSCESGTDSCRSGCGIGSSPPKPWRSAMAMLFEVCLAGELLGTCFCWP